MKTIFTRANKSLQNNPQTPSYTLELKQSNSNNEPTRADDNSILNRIKLNKKGPQKPKAITVTKGEDFNAHAFDIARIQKKTIQKDISKRLNRPHISDYEEELKVDEDSNQEQINQGKGHFTVSLKNLSSKVTDQDLKYILSNETYIIGSRIENGSGEIIFSKKDAAKEAANILNGTILKGSKIRASCINEINLLPYNPTTNKTERIETKEPELPNYLNGRLQFEKKPEISQVTNQDEEEKPSILSRIKKHKY